MRYVVDSEYVPSRIHVCMAQRVKPETGGNLNTLNSFAKNNDGNNFQDGITPLSHKGSLHLCILAM